MVHILQTLLPRYSVSTEPDHKAIGKLIDDELRRHFMGQTIVVRGISSDAHLGKSIDDLVEIIERDGTDRYDQARVGDRYENIQGKHIDFFAFRRKVTPRMQLFKDISWGFYHGGVSIHGAPIRIDMLIIYDAAKVRRVTHQYEGRTDVKRDGFAFTDPERKQEALLGILCIR